MIRRQILNTALWGGLALMGGSGALMLRSRPVAPLAQPGEPDDVCIVAPTFAYIPSSGLPQNAAREVPLEARCPVCGMYPARNRRWAAQVIFENGHVQFLDSPLSLFHYLQRVDHYTRGQSIAHITAMYVSDQRTGAWLDAREALYVHDSSVPGPMRAGNLPAFPSEEEANAFAARYGGAVLTAATLRHALPESLQRLAPHLDDAHSTPL